MIDEQFISRLLQATNIIDVIGYYIPLKKSGSNYKARCPFHEEKSPSFLVSETKQIYKCFGCGKSGNVIGFVKDYEKISFIDAVKRLAERINLQIPDTKEKAVKNSKIELIYTIYKLTEEFFFENLEKHGQMAKRYLQNRSVTDESIQKFRIGYSLDSFSSLKSYLSRNHINDDILIESGLFKNGEKGIYDMFRDRLMFPIHSVTGKVVAFGGRAMTAEQEKMGKYINSPTTPIYTKGKELYGLHQSRFEIAKKDSVIIVEGYMDFLRLWESGFHQIVASLGTALTPEQIHLLSRYTENYYLLYDGDNAGMNAAIKASALILSKGFVPRIISLPDKHDPDSFLLNFPKDKMQERIDASVTLPVFLFQHPELMDAKKALHFLTEVSAQINDTISRELFIKEISDTFKISETGLLKQSHRKPEIQHKNQGNRQVEKYSEEKCLLGCMIRNPRIIKKVASELSSDYFITEKYRILYKTLTESDMINYLENPAEFLEKVEDEEEKNALSSLLFESDYSFNEDDLILQIKLRKYQEDLNIINEEISKNPDNTELYEKKFFLKKEIQLFTKHVVHKTLF